VGTRQRPPRDGLGGHHRKRDAAQSFFGGTRAPCGLWAFVRLLNDFTIQANPIFWLRLWCYAYCCNTLLRWLGPDAGLEQRPLHFDAMIKAAHLPARSAAGDQDPQCALRALLDSGLRPPPSKPAPADGTTSGGRYGRRRTVDGPRHPDTPRLSVNSRYG
jgi:hypothetical protein